MIVGSVNANREAIIRLLVGAPEGQTQEIEAIIDTGFTGFMSLPPDLVESLGLADVELAHILEAGQPRRGDPVFVARLHEALQQRLAALIGLDKGDHTPPLQEDIVAGRPEGGGARRAKGRSSAKPERMAIALAFDKKEWIAAFFQAIEPVKRHAVALRLIPDQLGVPLARHAIANAQKTAIRPPVGDGNRLLTGPVRVLHGLKPERSQKFKRQMFQRRVGLEADPPLRKTRLDPKLLSKLKRRLAQR